ncbi:hypothetical protein RAS1_16490 [Phycisphaerae bacterium RAS1]|nr:hypothetical protein RAS1_16490 [Phycisphaerae bacterium RAS1]
MHRINQRNVWALVLIAACFGAGVERAAAQQAGNDDQAQVDALNAYAGQQAGKLTPEDYVQLSRLLSSPADQVRWLIAVVEDWNAKGRSDEAAALSRLTDARIDAWAGRGIAGLDLGPLRERLAKLQPKKPESETEKKVAKALEKAFYPGGRVAEPWILIDQDKLLATAASGEGEVEVQIGRALLRMALGMLPEDSKPERWAGVAQQLENRRAMTWAALARFVQAACSNDATEQKALLSRAREGLKSADKTFEKAGPGILSAISRCEEKAPFVEEHFPPLGFESACAQRRAAVEQDIKRQWSGGNKEALFGLMQAAKAAEIGLDGNLKALSLADLEKFLGGGFPRIHVFVEMLKIDDSYYGLFCGSTNSLLNKDDKFQTELLGPESSPIKLLEKATSRVAKLGGQSMILAAVDGDARTAAGLSALTGSLAGYVSDKSGGESYLKYMPSAAAFEKGCWTMRRATRWWCLQGYEDGRFFDYIGNRESSKQDRPPSPENVMLANFAPKQQVRALAAWSVDKVMAELKKNAAARSYGLLLVSEETR